MSDTGAPPSADAIRARIRTLAIAGGLPGIRTWYPHHG